MKKGSGETAGILEKARCKGDRGTHCPACRGYDFSEKTDIQTFHRHFIDQMEQPQGRIGGLMEVIQWMNKEHG